MKFPDTRPGPEVVAAMLCSAALTAQLVGGKAARDALFLAQLSVTSLPTMVIVTSLASIALVVASSKGIARLTPAIFVPLAYWASAMLFIVEWALTSLTPKVAPVLVYLHMSALGPVLASGFWLIATESFDPRTAKKRFGQIAGAGTLGGIVGGLLAERTGAIFGVTAVLPFLAVLNVLGALAVRRLAAPQASHAATSTPAAARSLAPESLQSGLRVFNEVPYLRHLAALVLLGTMSAAFVDYVFKVQAVQAFGRGEHLLRFFAIYYTATSVITFIVQASSSRFLLERFGLALATSLPSVAVLGGSVLALVAPDFRAIVGVRGAETIFRGSLFRFGYELFYTPIPAAQKRSVKSIIDVGFDRLGDAVGAGIIRLVLLTAPVAQYSILLFLGVASSGVAVIVASRLNRGYIRSLEKSLLNRAVEFDLSDVQDGTTRTTMIKTLAHRRGTLDVARTGDTKASAPNAGIAAAGDPEVQEILWLRSRNREQTIKVLRRDECLTAGLVPHVIPLLAWGPVASDAVFALRKVAEERVGELADALIDPNQDFAVRRRLARVFSVCVSQRAVDSLMLGLDDLRFEVRFQCGRSLAAVVDRNPRVRIDRERILEVVLREVAVGRPVWESRRLLDGLEAGDTGSFVDEFVRDRAGQSLAHVFTLLSFVMAKDPLLIAFRGLHTGDRNLRGTALEYLEGVLPQPIRDHLWPFLEDNRPRSGSPRPREEILADLLRSNNSIMVNLEELKRLGLDGRAGAAEPASVSSGANPFDPGA
jgi:ATP:ADP antiporter, AAA family